METCIVTCCFISDFIESPSVAFKKMEMFLELFLPLLCGSCVSAMAIHGKENIIPAFCLCNFHEALLCKLMLVLCQWDCQGTHHRSVQKKGVNNTGPAHRWLWDRLGIRLVKCFSHAVERQVLREICLKCTHLPVWLTLCCALRVTRADSPCSLLWVSCPRAVLSGTQRLILNPEPSRYSLVLLNVRGRGEGFCPTHAWCTGGTCWELFLFWC